MSTPHEHSGQSSVLVESRGPVQILTLNRPAKLNAADLEMQRQLLEQWRHLSGNDQVKAVVLTGAGRAFCAGGDMTLLKGLATAPPAVRDELSRINGEMLGRVLGLEMPLIAAVNGPAIGFGAALVALCDVVVMGASAYLSEPHVKYGLPASPAIQLIWPELTSRAVAKELLMTGRRVEAEEALRLGLVNRVVPSGMELIEALAVAELLVSHPPSGVVAVKRAFNDPLIREVRRDGDP